MLPIYSLLALCVAVHGAHNTHAPTSPPKTDHQYIQELLAENAVNKRQLEDLTRQVMLQQTYVEERIRTDGSSGLKQVRSSHAGAATYYTEGFVSRGVAGIHEHSNNERTVGMGELNFVLNGVEFRTRHNDYRLRMPVANDKTYNKVVDVPYPDVPPAVLAKHTVAEQVEEMKEWFKAFKTQDHSHRDYRKYFKPVMCYMEGGWTSNTKTLEEPFFSDRHFIDASSWFDLQDKVRFTSYSGGKSNLENFAYLPTTIMNVVNGTPEYAQWNYRIVCHPLKDDLPLSAFKLEDDVQNRMKIKSTMAKMNESRMARYSLRERIPSGTHHRNFERAYHWGLLDELMAQVPGKDNYGVVIDDDALGLTLYDIRSNTEPMVKVNTAHYNRFYKVIEKDAMGNKLIKRGFSDPNMFAAQIDGRVSLMDMLEKERILRQFYFNEGNPASYAGPRKLFLVLEKKYPGIFDLTYIKQWLNDQDAYSLQKTRRHKFKTANVRVTAIGEHLSEDNDGTTNPKISGLAVTTCHTVRHGHHRDNVCKTVEERFTWAVPLEIIYMTPLLKWNPYNFHHVAASRGPTIYPVVHGPNGTRNGGLTPEKAYNGTHGKVFYRTPVEFFSTSKSVGADKADTSKGAVGVLDRHGVVRKVVASGTRILLPEIPGVGKVRMRYPIVPLHSDGQETRKELDALKDMVMKMPTYSPLFEELPTTVSKANTLYMEEEHVLKVAPTTRDPPGLHDHEITIHQYEIDDMKKGQTISGLLTSVENGHQHSVDIKMDSHGNYIMVKCDGMAKCWDGHDTHLIFDH